MRIRFDTDARFFFEYSKGISRSALPYRKTAPSWVKTTATEVKEEIFKMAKKGLTPSQIGVTLRDSMAIPQVAQVTGAKILRILKTAGVPTFWFLLHPVVRVFRASYSLLEKRWSSFDLPCSRGPPLLRLLWRLGCLPLLPASKHEPLSEVVSVLTALCYAPIRRSRPRDP